MISAITKVVFTCKLQPCSQSLSLEIHIVELLEFFLAAFPPHFSNELPQ